MWYTTILHILAIKSTYGTAIATGLKSIFLAICVYFTPTAPLIFLVSVTVILDTIIGVAKSKKLLQPIKSRKLARIIYKTIFYTACILLIYGLDNLILNDMFSGVLKHFLDTDITIKHLSTKLMAILLMTIEFYSIDEKIKEMNDDKGFWYYYRRIMNGMRRVSKDLNKLTDKKE